MNTYPLADSTRPVQLACTTTACRWGDYNAQVLDYWSCDALNAGLTPECGLVWETSEYIYTPTSNVSFGNGVPECHANQECQASQIIALYDGDTSSENSIMFIGYSSAESECSGTGTCYLSISPPAGVRPGDVLIMAMAAAGAQQNVPNLPNGWNALGFVNQNGSQYVMSSDEYGNQGTGWLLSYVYGTLGSGEPGQYSFGEPASGGEIEGLMLAYRGVGTGNEAIFKAKGFGVTGNNNLSVSTGAISGKADQKLVAFFLQGGDECYGSEFGGANNFTAPTPSGLNVMTPLTISGDAFIGFAAQAFTGSGGTFGPHGSTVSAPTCGGVSASIPLAWMVLLPPY